jgi:hypothetical protein
VSAAARGLCLSPRTHPRSDEGATREGGAVKGEWGGGRGPEGERATR